MKRSGYYFLIQTNIVVNHLRTPSHFLLGVLSEGCRSIYLPVFVNEINNLIVSGVQHMLHFVITILFQVSEPKKL